MVDIPYAKAGVTPHNYMHLEVWCDGYLVSHVTEASAEGWCIHLHFRPGATVNKSHGYGEPVDWISRGKVVIREKITMAESIYMQRDEINFIA